MNVVDFACIVAFTARAVSHPRLCRRKHTRAPHWIAASRNCVVSQVAFGARASLRQKNVRRNSCWYGSKKSSTSTTIDTLESRLNREANKKKCRYEPTRLTEYFTRRGSGAASSAATTPRYLYSHSFCFRECLRALKVCFLDTNTHPLKRGSSGEHRCNKILSTAIMAPFLTQSFMRSEDRSRCCVSRIFSQAPCRAKHERGGQISTSKRNKCRVGRGSSVWAVRLRVQEQLLPEWQGGRTVGPRTNCGCCAGVRCQSWGANPSRHSQKRSWRCHHQAFQ